MLFDENYAIKVKDLQIKYGMLLDLLKGGMADAEILKLDASKAAIEWFESKFQKALHEIEDHH